MTRLDWSALGQRYFETGIDRGVLFVNDVGYAWPGLTSVSESPTGGDARPFYLDGIKYLNLAAAEEFEATIEAFQAPKEFGVCDGTASVHNGLFATQQPRKSFGLSYRTKIGNDVDGTEHAYKVHLVYNALAAPSTRSNSSMGDSVDPGSYSWSITTLAPLTIGLRPTAHFIIDSRFTPADLLAEVEDILYGSNSGAASLPTVPELMTLFGSAVYDAGVVSEQVVDTLDGGLP